MSHPVTRRSVEERARLISEGRIDAVAAIETAIACGDADTACELVLARASIGTLADPARVARILPDIHDMSLFTPVVRVTDGDRVTMLLDLVDGDRMSEQRDALALFLAVTLRDGSDADARIATLLRLRARRTGGPESLALLALTAKKLRDPSALAVCEPFMSLAVSAERGFARTAENQLRAPLLSTLPAPSATPVVQGFTAQRAVPKIGRNDPCHCGSGKKYKKCCESNDAGRRIEPAPTHAPPVERYVAKVTSLTPSEVSEMRVHELMRLEMKGVPTQAVITAIRRLADFRRWEVAERALEELATRTEVADTIDEYRVELMHMALVAGALGVARRQVEKFRDPSNIPHDMLLDLDLARPDVVAIDRIEQQVRTALADPTHCEVVELAFVLLRRYPALGVLVGRAAIHPSRVLDAEALVESIEEARDRLGLPPWDRASDLFEEMLDASAAESFGRVDRALDAERDRLEAEGEELRTSLRHAKRHAGALEAALREKEVELSRLRTVAAGRPTSPNATVAPKPSSADADAARLKARIEELKQLVRESNTERAELRRKVAKVSASIEKSAPPSAARSVAPEEPFDPVDPPRGLCVPVFDASSRGAIEKLPVVVARRAVVLIGELAAGAESAWKQTKRIVSAAAPILETRIGIHHRVLFRIADGELRVIDVVHRKDLDAAIRRAG